VILDWTAIDNEYSFITGQASTYGVGAELTNYVAAKGALSTYLSGLAPAWNDTTADTPITGSTFRTKFANVYLYRQAVLDVIAGIAKTLADAAQITADAAADAAGDAGIAAADAQNDADTANAAISNISSDNVLSKGEKGQVILDWAAIAGEQAGIDAQATAYSITTEKTAYDNAVAALSTYLSGLSPAWNDTTTDTAITATTFRSKFADVYTTRQALLNKIAAVAGTLATWASVSGTGKPADNATVGAQFGVNISGQAATADIANGAVKNAQIDEASVTTLKLATGAAASMVSSRVFPGALSSGAVFSQLDLPTLAVNCRAFHIVHLMGLIETSSWPVTAEQLVLRFYAEYWTGSAWATQNTGHARAYRFKYQADDTTMTFAVQYSFLAGETPSVRVKFTDARFYTAAGVYVSNAAITLAESACGVFASYR
jgi:hypothetical protein